MPLSPVAWYHAKLFVQHASALSMDGLHVIAGVVLQLAFARLLRSSVARPVPLIAVLVLEIANEIYDLAIERWPSLPTQLGESARDILVTMLLPTLLFVVARRRPALFDRETSQDPVSAEAVEPDPEIVPSASVQG